MAYLADYVHHLPEGDYADAAQFSVAVGHSTVVNESIHPADSITGRVTDRTTGLPVSGTVVYAWGGGVWDEWGVHPNVQTDELGRYRIEGLAPGSYVVCFAGSLTTGTPVGYQGACWKDQPESYDAGNPVQVDGFGTTVHGINQSLTMSVSP